MMVVNDAGSRPGMAIRSDTSANGRALRSALMRAPSIPGTAFKAVAGPVLISSSRLALCAGLSFRAALAASTRCFSSAGAVTCSPPGALSFSVRGVESLVSLVSLVSLGPGILRLAAGGRLLEEVADSVAVASADSVASESAGASAGG